MNWFALFGWIKSRDSLSKTNSCVQYTRSKIAEAAHSYPISIALRYSLRKHNGKCIFNTNTHTRAAITLPMHTHTHILTKAVRYLWFVDEVKWDIGASTPDETLSIGYGIFSARTWQMSVDIRTHSTHHLHWFVVVSCFLPGKNPVQFLQIETKKIHDTAADTPHSTHLHPSSGQTSSQIR